jgi:hypothetical protein
MRKIAMTVAAAALCAGPLLTGATAQVAQSSHDTTTYAPTPTPVIQPLDCQSGSTDIDNNGCRPGWVWRSGDQGLRCYPC